MNKLIVLGMSIPYPYPTHGHPTGEYGVSENREMCRGLTVR